MKYCQPHWDKLCAAIDSRQLGRLLAAKDSDARARAIAALQTVHWMIVSAVRTRSGLALFYGDLCPVCEGIKSNAGLVDPHLGRVYTPAEEEAYWIDGPADAVLDIARNLGLADAP
jgi:hypothetical protein